MAENRYTEALKMFLDQAVSCAQRGAAEINSGNLIEGLASMAMITPSIEAARKVFMEGVSQRGSLSPEEEEAIRQWLEINIELAEHFRFAIDLLRRLA